MAKEYVKRIPEELQSRIGLQRFKISLIKCKNNKQLEQAKTLLDFKTKEIFEDRELQSKDKAINYLKIALNTYLNKENIKNFKVLNEEINKNVEQSNILTIQSIILEQIEASKLDFQEKMKALKEIGVDTSIKIDNTTNAYYAILSKVNEHFGSDYNIDNLDFEKAKEFAKQFKNNTYIAHLKSIFKKAKEKHINIDNVFHRIGMSTYYKYLNKGKKDEKEVIYYSEIIEILEEIETKEQKEELKNYFLTLLFTGMRNDELASIKKKNIISNNFLFKDSKGYFNKVVPIKENDKNNENGELINSLNIDLMSYINNKIKDLNNEDYVFFNKNKSSRRVSQIRDKFNKLLSFKKYKKTLHDTRATFVSYINYYLKSSYSDDYLTILTHQANGVDQNTYNVATNVKILKEIINSIDLEKLKEIEEEMKLLKPKSKQEE